MTHWRAERGIAAFVGVTRLGPAPTRLIRSWPEYLDTVGSSDDGFLGPAVQGYFANGGSACYVASVGTSPHEITVDALWGNASTASGSVGLASITTAPDVSFVCIPDAVLLEDPDPGFNRLRALQTAAIAHCESQGDRLALLDPPARLNAAAVYEYRASLPESACAVLHYPWLRTGAGDSAVPPSGHIAGAYARSDATVGLHVPPVNRPLRGVVAVDRAVGDYEQDTLFPSGINTVAMVDGCVRILSCRTLAYDPRWRNVAVQRTMNFLGRTLARGTTWATGRSPSDRTTWAELVTQVKELMLLAWRSGVLEGDSPQNAFAVRCDAETNPAESVAAGCIRMWCNAVLPGATEVSFVLVWRCAY